MVISSSCVGARRKGEPFLSSNLKTWGNSANGNCKNSRQLTSESSFNLPVRFHSHWEEIEDKETLDAPVETQ